MTLNFKLKLMTLFSVLGAMQRSQAADAANDPLIDQYTLRMDRSSVSTNVTAASFNPLAGSTAVINGFDSWESEHQIIAKSSTIMINDWGNRLRVKLSFDHAASISFSNQIETCIRDFRKDTSLSQLVIVAQRAKRVSTTILSTGVRIYNFSIFDSDSIQCHGE